MFRYVVCATLLSLSVDAAIYESAITADDEDDLRSAADRGEISDATLETLLELMQDGVDLNTAGREELYELPGLLYADVDAIVAYRKNQGHIDDPSVLVGAGAITAEQLIQIAPFIIVSDEQVKVPVGGHYHLLTNYTVGDPLAPTAYLRARVRGPFSLTGALGLAFTRRKTGSPFFDPYRESRDTGGDLGTLTVTPPDYRVEVPKFFLQWKGTKFKVVAGTFRIGFAQRLTLDNTTRYTPNGITPDDAFFLKTKLSSNCHESLGEKPTGTEVCPPKQYVTEDVRWRDPFRGVALAAEDLELGDTARASLYAFGSFQTLSVYQYYLYSRRSCTDPRDDTNPDCGSPNVYVRVGDGSQPETKLKYGTLPNLLDALTTGGHARLTPFPSWSIGVTGYFGMPFWHVPELQLDFQEYVRYPFGGPFGAVGLDTRLTLGPVDFYLEAARTFDREPNGGGGWGIVQRTVWGSKKREFEAVARFYDIRFINPYARPIASDDQVDGQRARNEAGLLLKYSETSLSDFRLTFLADFWALPSDEKGLEYDISGYTFDYKAGTMNTRAQARVDYEGWQVFEPSLWFEWRDKDLLDTNLQPASMGRECYTTRTGLAPGTLVCTGERYRFATRLLFRPIPKKLELWFTYTHDFFTNPKYPQLDQTLRFTAEVHSQPVPWLIFRLRSTYLNEDIFSTLEDMGGVICVSGDGESGGTCLEKSLWTYLKVSYVGFKPLHVTARYDVFMLLDKRSGTIDRVPNPEHRLRLELEGRF